MRDQIYFCYGLCDFARASCIRALLKSVPSITHHANCMPNCERPSSLKHVSGQYVVYEYSTSMLATIWIICISIFLRLVVDLASSSY